jgi:hypothetical protein
MSENCAKKFSMTLRKIVLLAVLLLIGSKNLKSESAKSKIISDVALRTIASEHLERFQPGTVNVDIDFRRADLHRHGDMRGWDIAIVDSLYQDMQLYNGVKRGILNANVYDTSAFTLSYLYDEMYQPGVMSARKSKSDSAATIIIGSPIIAGWGQLDILEEVVGVDDDSDFTSNKHEYIYFNKQYDSSILHIPVTYTKRVGETQVDFTTFIYDYRVYMSAKKDRVEYIYIKTTLL